MFASVEENSSSGWKPCALIAACAMRTSSCVASVRPAGRSPIFLTSAATGPFRVERAAFSAATDCSTRSRNAASSSGQFVRRLRSKVELRPHAVRDRVDRRAAAGDARAVGGPGVRRHRDAAEPCDRVRHGEHGVHRAERAVAVPARSREGDPVALRADAAHRDALHIRAVHGDERADPVLVSPLLEQMAHPAQVARALLAHVGDEQQIGAGPHRGGIHGAQPGQQHRERARVVADAGREQPRALTPHREVGAGRKHRVQMGRNADQPAVARTGTQAGHIALGVDPQVLQAVRLRHGEERLRAIRLLEGGGGHLRQRNDVRHRPVMLGGERGERIAIDRARHDLADDRSSVTGHAGFVLAGASRYWTRPAASARCACLNGPTEGTAWT